MAKRHHKALSVLLAALMTASTASIAASAATVEGAASGAGTLSKHYATNPGGVGANKTISVDGDLSDWDSSMLIAQGTANDDPRVYRDASMHENPIDLYALYAAYDDSNLYLMWEMTNVQDCVSDEGYPLSQGVLWQTEELPFFIAVDTGKSDAIGNSGKLQTAGTIWDSGMSIANSFNRLISINTKGGNGPYVYGGDSSGLNPVEMLGPKGTPSKVKMGFGLGIISKEVWGIDGGYGPSHNRVPGDMCGESAAWVEFNGKGHASATKDFFYELSIPYDELGITKSDVESTGLGVLLVATYGKSGMDCLPYDLAMNDNADQPDTQSQPGNSFEKSDEDNITTPFARVGNGTINPRPSDNDTATQQDTETQQDTSTDTSTDTNVDIGSGEINVNADAKNGDTVDVTLSVGGHSNLFGISNEFTFDAGKYQFVSAETLATGAQINDTGAPNGQLQWNLQCGDGNNGEDYSSAKPVVKMTFKAIADASGKLGANKVRDCYDYDFKSLSLDCVKADVKVTSNVSSDTQSDKPTDTETKTDTDTDKQNPVVDIPVTAEAGDTVTVKFKAKNAANALGIGESVNFDTSALEYVKQNGGMGHIDVSTGSGKLGWTSMFDAQGTSITNESDVCILEFKAKKNIAAGDKVLSYKVEEFYDVNNNNFDAASTTSAVAETTKATPVVQEFKIPVDAKSGDEITVYFKTKDAAKALGIQETVKFDNLALKFEEQVYGIGHADINADEADKFKWSVMFDANGQDFTAETDVFVVKFTALRDITSAEDVLSYIVDEFYDVNYSNFDPAATTRGVAEVLKVDTNTESNTDTNTESNPDTNTESNTDTNTESNPDTDTSTASDTDDTDSGEEVLLGDVNGDTKITAKDSMMAQRAAIKLSKLDAKQTFLADVDQDKKVSTKDCMHILRYSIHLNSNSKVGTKVMYKPE